MTPKRAVFVIDSPEAQAKKEKRKKVKKKRKESFGIISSDVGQRKVCIKSADSGVLCCDLYSSQKSSVTLES